MARPPIQMPSNPTAMGSDPLPERPQRRHQSAVRAPAGARLAGDRWILDVLRRALEDQLIGLEGAVPVSTRRPDLIGCIECPRLLLPVAFGHPIPFVVLREDINASR